jgi:hypothetical protein
VGNHRNPSSSVSMKKCRTATFQIYPGGLNWEDAASSLIYTASNPFMNKVEEGANIVIVGHSLGKDFITIENLVPGVLQSGAITTIIDRSALHGKIKLATLLEHLGIGQNVKQSGLNCAGNDANYTLRAVLGAVRELEIEFENGRREMDSDVNEWGDLVRRIAVEGIPDLVRDGGYNRKKKSWKLRGKQNGEEGKKGWVGSIMMRLWIIWV